MNRIVSVCGGDAAAVARAAASISTTEDWIETFLDLASEASRRGDDTARAAYLRAANFYLSPDDPRKLESYEAYVSIVRSRWAAEFASGSISTALVPYEGGFLPVWAMSAERRPGARRPGRILFHLGYDSLKEELLPVMSLFRDEGMDVWLFEGPGQGEALYRYGLPMTHEWERPVRAVIDYLGLDELSLVGLSLGGYLAPRAAMRERRIERVVAWGAMYDFLGVVSSRRGRAFEAFIKGALALRARRLLDAAVGAKMRRDSYTRWGLEHGMWVLGAEDAYGYFEAVRRFSLRGSAAGLTQDLLVLHGAGDHFVPEEDFWLQARASRGARSVTARLFTEAEGAENHVQFGNLPLAVRVICAWIREREAS